MKYIIQSNTRQAERAPAFFCAIHGFSPLFVRTVDKARKFATPAEAKTYANAELFTEEKASTIIPVSS
jgi:hypothetical protein